MSLFLESRYSDITDNNIDVKIICTVYERLLCVFSQGSVMQVVADIPEKKIKLSDVPSQEGLHHTTILLLPSGVSPWIPHFNFGFLSL